MDIRLPNVSSAAMSGIDLRPGSEGGSAVVDIRSDIDEIDDEGKLYYLHRSSIPAKSLIYGPFTMCLLSDVYFIPRRESNFGPISSVCDFCLLSIMEHKHHTRCARKPYLT